MKHYEPPLSVEPFPENSWQATTVLAPGVRGFTYAWGDIIFIPFIMANREGDGDVGRFLDSLSYRCVIQSVTSDRLRGMLERRGFIKTIVQGDNFWVRGRHLAKQHAVENVRVNLALDMYSSLAHDRIRSKDDPPLIPGETKS